MSINIFHRCDIAAATLHQEGLHEVVEIAVEHALGVGCGISRPQVLDHLVRMQHIAAYLRPPFYLLLLALEFGLLLLALLKFDVIEPRLEDTESVFLVAYLRTSFGILHNYSRGNMPDPDASLHLVDVLATVAAAPEGIPRKRRRR